MPRYINADKARETATIDLIVHHLDRQPTADVAPVVHGRWIYSHEVGCPRYRNCSRCLMAYEDAGTPYCPNCGARMDGE